nr:MAG TPA: hypothetical protein [Caudoviricetes sp.]
MRSFFSRLPSLAGHFYAQIFHNIVQSQDVTRTTICTQTARWHNS